MNTQRKEKKTRMTFQNEKEEEEEKCIEVKLHRFAIELHAL